MKIIEVISNTSDLYGKYSFDRLHTITYSISDEGRILFV